MYRIKERIKGYIRATRIIFWETKYPLHTLILLKFKPPPYRIALKSGEMIVANDLSSIFDKLMGSYLERNFGSSDRYNYNHNGVTYRIHRFNSPATIFSTFIFQDWKKLNVKDKCVLDIGGYIGDTAIYFITQGAKRIVVYEPYPYSYKIALDNIAQNNLQKKIIIINGGVAGLDSSITINPEYANTNTTLAVAHPEVVRVPVVTLRTIVEEYDINEWVLKMNCEGCEYDALANVEIQTLIKFSEVLMHYHSDPQPLIGKLKEAGFNVRLNGYIYATKK